MAAQTVHSASTWGSPAATKHALLLHGLTCSSHSWYKVADSLASQGNFVTAPDLMGHASRSSAADYRVKTFAEDLLPYITARNYDLIIGHSLGGTIAMSLFKHLPPSHPTAFVLVDPALRLSKEQIDFFETMFTKAVEEVPGPEAILAQNPLWSRQDAIMREFELRLATVDAVPGYLRQNDPFCFMDDFHPISPKWKVTTLIAQNGPFYDYLRENPIPPPVRSVVVEKAGHWIHCDFPDRVIEETMKTVAELNAV